MEVIPSANYEKIIIELLSFKIPYTESCNFRVQIVLLLYPTLIVL